MSPRPRPSRSTIRQCRRSPVPGAKMPMTCNALSWVFTTKRWRSWIHTSILSCRLLVRSNRSVRSTIRRILRPLQKLASKLGIPRTPRTSAATWLWGPKPMVQTAGGSTIASTQTFSSRSFQTPSNTANVRSRQFPSPTRSPASPRMASTLAVTSEQTNLTPPMVYSLNSRKGTLPSTYPKMNYLTKIWLNECRSMVSPTDHFIFVSILISWHRQINQTTQLIVNYDYLERYLITS